MTQAQSQAQLQPAALTTAQAASYLSMCANGLARSRLTGDLFGTTPPAFVRYGRGVRYTVASLDSWLSALVAIQSEQEQE